VRTQAKREGEEGLKLKVLEKEEQIASMQRQIEECDVRPSRAPNSFKGKLRS